MAIDTETSAARDPGTILAHGAGTNSIDFDSHRANAAPDTPRFATAADAVYGGWHCDRTRERAGSSATLSAIT